MEKVCMDGQWIWQMFCYTWTLLRECLSCFNYWLTSFILCFCSPCCSLCHGCQTWWVVLLTISLFRFKTWTYKVKCSFPLFLICSNEGETLRTYSVFVSWLTGHQNKIKTTIRTTSIYLFYIQVQRYETQSASLVVKWTVSKHIVLIYNRKQPLQ